MSPWSCRQKAERRNGKFQIETLPIESLKELRERIGMMVYAAENDKDFPMPEDFEGLSQINKEIVRLNDLIVPEIFSK